MRSDPVEVKIGQVWRQYETRTEWNCEAGEHPVTIERTLHVVELTDRTFYGREGVPSARVHCTETGRRTVIALARFRDGKTRGMRLVSEDT